MLPSFAKQTVTRIRPGLKVERGSEVPDWFSTDEVAIAGCSVQPGDTTTRYGIPGRENVTVRWTLYAPPGSDIKAGDRIVYMGVAYSIDGEAMRWESPFGRNDHIVVKLIDWRG